MAITYGNWKRPTSPGILGLGLIGTACLISNLIFCVILAMSSLVPAIIWFIVGSGLMYLVVRKDKHNMSLLYRAIVRFSFMRQVAAHRGIYKSGPLSHIPNGNYRLPGIAANTGLLTYRDPQGRDQGILLHNNEYVTFVLVSEPEGAGLLDEDTIDQQVTRYGTFLNNLNNEPGLKSVTVTVETEPENGIKLNSEVMGRLSSEAGQFEADVMKEIVESYPEGAASINVYTAFTYSLKELNVEKQPVDNILRGIVSRLPLLAYQLEASGAGVCSVASSEKLFRIIRTAYDPYTQNLFDIADKSDDFIVDWDNVGPSIAEAKWDMYRTDSGIHKTYVMSQAPKGIVISNILEGLLKPDLSFLRKRVTIIYKPMGFEQSANKVQEDLKNAEFKVNSEKRANAKQVLAVKQARRTEEEEAHGIRLIRFGMVATITVPEIDDLQSTEAVIDNLAATSHIVLRSANGTQDSAFTAGLPLGLQLERYYSYFDSIKENI